MKKLDIYIIKKFLGAFFFWIGAFVIIAVVIDISENVDRLVESGSSVFNIATEYYIPFCIYFGNLLSPFIVFLSIIWVTSKMAQRSEVIAILSGGISYNRFVAPFVVAGILMGGVVLLASHFIVPISNRIKYEFENQHIRGAHNYGLNIHRELEDGKMYYFRNIDGVRSVGYDFSIEDWDGGKMTRKLIASKAKFDTVNTQWQLSDVLIREFLPNGKEKLSTSNKMDTVMAIRFLDFGAPSEIVFNMKTPELTRYIEKEEKKGSSTVANLEIEKYFRTSNAFSIIILSFIAVVMSSKKVRGGLGLHLFLALVLGILFIFFSRMSSVAATNVGLPTYLAVWLPNVVYLALGLWIYRKAPK